MTVQNKPLSVVGPADSSVRRNNPVISKPITASIKSITDRISHKFGAIDELRSLSRELERKLIAQAYAEGLEMARAPRTEWMRFIAEPHWVNFPKRKPKPADQSCAVEHVMGWYLGAGKRAPKKKSEIVNAIRWLEHGTRSPADIYKVLAGKQSLRKLADKWAAVQRETGRKAGAATPSPVRTPVAAAAMVQRNVAQVAKKPAAPPKAGRMKASNLTIVKPVLTFPDGPEGLLSQIDGIEIVLLLRVDKTEDGVFFGTVLSWSVAED